MGKKCISTGQPLWFKTFILPRLSSVFVLKIEIEASIIQIKLTNSGIPSTVLECGLPIGQRRSWNGQMEGIYTSVSSTLIRNGNNIHCPVAQKPSQSVLILLHISEHSHAASNYSTVTSSIIILVKMILSHFLLQQFLIHVPLGCRSLFNLSTF